METDSGEPRGGLWAVGMLPAHRPRWQGQLLAGLASCLQMQLGYSELSSTEQVFGHGLYPMC